MKLKLKETIRVNGKQHLPPAVVDTKELGISDTEAQILVRRGTADLVEAEEAVEADEQRQAREQADAASKAKAEEEANAAAEAEAKAKEESEAKVKADADAAAKATDTVAKQTKAKR